MTENETVNHVGQRVMQLLMPDDCVLDLGCGVLQPFAGRPPVARYLGVDGHKESVQYVSRRAMAMHGLVPDVLSVFADKSWDVVLLLDVIEHLPKMAAEFAITAAKRIARKKVIVFTPDGYIPQEAFDYHGLGTNPLQAHLCGFSEAEMQTLGFKTVRLLNDSLQYGIFHAVFGVCHP